MASAEPESETIIRRLDSDDESDEDIGEKRVATTKEDGSEEAGGSDEEVNEAKGEKKKVTFAEDSDSETSGGPIRKMVSDDDEEEEEEVVKGNSTTRVSDDEAEEVQKKRVNDDDDDDDKDDKDDDADSDDSESDDSDDDVQDDAGEDKEDGNNKDNAGVDADDDDDGDDDDEDNRKPANSTIYDFDIMMAKKKEENSRKRRRRGYDIINDNDDIIADIINQMKDAVEADIEANKNKQVATSKLKLLPFLVNQLRKVDLRDAFLDSDVLSVMTEWLAPLPDRSLPHLNIRENLLKILIDFDLYDVDRIKGSGIGKAVMYLYKHPRESKENKQRCKQLISAWSRPIFNLDSSFSSISREEREERDKELQKRASRALDSSDGEGSSQVLKRPKTTEQQPAKNPGDKGWVPRARVPAPSMRDYVIRPRSKVDGDIGKGSKRPANVLEKLMKTHQERRRANKQQRAINMKIDKL